MSYLSLVIVTDLSLVIVNDLISVDNSLVVVTVTDHSLITVSVVDHSLVIAIDKAWSSA